MLKSTYTPPPPLPPGWTEHKAPSGHTYYYHPETKKSTYTRPSLPAAAPEPIVNPIPQATFSPFPAPTYGHQAAHTGGQFIRQGRGRGDFRGGRGYQDSRQRQPQDRPKTKHAIPGCTPWVLVKTKLGRRFVHNPETNESCWKFPQEVLKGVIEYDRLEREKQERGERGEESEEAQPEKDDHEAPPPEERASRPHSEPAAGKGEEYDSDEYEEVEVTDDEDEDAPSKRPRTGQEDGEPRSVEFDEDDIAYQLAAMGESYGLDEGEYGEPGEEGWEEGAEGLPLTEEDSRGLFFDLLDDYQINPYTPWEKIVEEGRIIEDDRYTVLPNMKSRRDVHADWSRDRIQRLKEQRAKEEKKDPRIRYLAFLQDYANPKLYWAEFKRKYRKDAEMKGTQISDKEKEKLYRDHVARLKLPENTRKSDLSSLLKSIPLHQLNRISTIENLPTAILTDLRYISLPPKVRDPLIETYISTLPAAPEKTELSVEEQEEQSRKRQEREKRERALAEREKKVQEEKRRQRGALMHGKDMLRYEEAEVERAMRVGKEGLRSHIQPASDGANAAGISPENPAEK